MQKLMTRPRANRNGFYQKIGYEGEQLSTGFTIKHLHSWARFETLISKILSDIFPKLSSSKSISIITWMFVNIIKDTMKCKTWGAKGEKTVIRRVLIDTSVYLVIINKIVDLNTNCITRTSEPHLNLKSEFNIIDCMRSIVAQNNLLILQPL